MREFVVGRPEQFAIMKEKLDAHPGTIFRYKNIKLAEGYLPSECNLDIACIAPDKYHMEFYETVSGPVESNELRNFLQNGIEGSFEQIVSAFRTYLKVLAVTESVENNACTNIDTKPIITGLPETEDITSCQSKLLEYDSLLEGMKQQIIGHNDQIETICKLAVNHYSKVDPKRPISVIICGETGCGKTWTAEVFQKTAAKQIEGYSLIRVNLNEYKDATAANRFVGSSPGYIGYGDDSVFETLFTNDYAVVLFDEVEKAHPEVLDMLMQIIDRGELKLASSHKGKDTISFKHCVLIFTSNLPIDKKELEKATDPEECIRTALSKKFRSEFVARIGYATFYSAPSKKERAEIAALCMNSVADEYGIRIRKVDYRVLLPLLKEQTAFGTRILKSRIERLYGYYFGKAHKESMSDVSVEYNDESEDIIMKPYDETGSLAK